MSRKPGLRTGIALALFLAVAAIGAQTGVPLAGVAAAADNPAHSGTPPSLEQRRRAALERKIHRAETECRTVSGELSGLKNRPCAAGDRLDPATNICHPRRNVWMPYIRWDPAAGRCKPRDVFDGASCVGSRQRYDPGKHHAHTLPRSISMYRQAAVRLEGRLDDCRQAETGMKHRAASERSKSTMLCEQARKLNRVDLVQFYCK